MIKQSLMKLKDTAAFFLAVANAFNPLAYRSVAKKSVKPVIGHLLYLLLIVTMATAALVLPSIANLNSGISSQLDKFSKFDIKTELATKAPIESGFPWLGNMKIFINTTADAKKSAQYDVVLTGTELRTKPLLCFFRSEICSLFRPKQNAKPIRELDLVKGSGKGELAGTASALILLMLPGLLILFYLSMVVKYTAIIIAASALAYLAIKISKGDASLLDALKIAAYAATVLIVLDFAAFLLQHSPVAIPAFLPLAAYAIVLIVALFFSEQGLAEGRL
ncbi:DUF1189 family protein [Candidatus Woesearchaeota archaeon]|nr:DUF1189 family protein [Candidatus Woesearchaeota archaeon]